MLSSDTIVAISSAPGSSARGILRLSGSQAWTLALSVAQIVSHPTESQSPGGHRAYPIRLTSASGATGIPGLLLLFRGPRSYTGLDVAELHLPGSPALLHMVQESLMHDGGGARQAGPGEFTAQAFFNGKMDLTHAEGIAATIAAGNERQLRAAANLRDGDLHQWVAQTCEQLADLLALVEAEIDFSDESGVHFISAADIQTRLAAVLERIILLERCGQRWEGLDQLPVVVFTGQANVGKSSLINALTGQPRAIVSPVAGTTRDALSTLMPSRLGSIRLVDVAGIEPASHELSNQMSQTRLTALQTADLVVLILDWQDDTDNLPHDPAAGGSHPLVVQNKIDLAQALPRATSSEVIQVSALTGQGLEELRAVICRRLQIIQGFGAEHLVTLNQRHRGLLAATRDALAHTTVADSSHAELLASDLRHALNLLGQITGTISPDDILGRIFSSFCIGK